MMKEYNVCIMESRMYRIYMGVVAETELHAEEKALNGEGKILSEKLIDVDHVEAIEVEEVK